jgi:hypothetical protein
VVYRWRKAVVEVILEALHTIGKQTRWLASGV